MSRWRLANPCVEGTPLWRVFQPCLTSRREHITEFRPGSGHTTPYDLSLNNDSANESICTSVSSITSRSRLRFVFPETASLFSEPQCLLRIRPECILGPQNDDLMPRGVFFPPAFCKRHVSSADWLSEEILLYQIQERSLLCGLSAEVKTTPFVRWGDCVISVIREPIFSTRIQCSRMPSMTPLFARIQPHRSKLRYSTKGRVYPAAAVVCRVVEELSAHQNYTPEGI